MTKTIIEKVKTKYGIRLEVHFGSVSSSLYFDDEAEYYGFVCMLRMMVSMNAASVSVECPDPEQPDKPEQKDPAHCIPAQQRADCRDRIFAALYAAAAPAAVYGCQRAAGAARRGADPVCECMAASAAGTA